MFRSRLPQLRPRQKRELRHWAIELVVVVVGVLLALFAAEWAEGRREAAEHERRIARMDNAIVKVAADAAAERAAAMCEDARIEELKVLLDSNGREWPGSSFSYALSLPDELLFPLPLIVNLEATPSDAFEAAEAAGTIATLDEEEADYYRARRLQFEYLEEAYDRGLQAILDLSVLSEPRTLSQDEVDTARKALAEAEFAKLIRRVQGQQMVAAYLERHGEPSPSFWTEFTDSLGASAFRNGDCFAPINPVTGEPWDGNTR